MLEALLQDPRCLMNGKGPRAALFKLFTQIWNSVSINDNPDVAPLRHAHEQRLSNITPLPRQAFLLLSLEGLFPEGDAPSSSDVDVPRACAPVEMAGREMAARSPPTC